MNRKVKATLLLTLLGILTMLPAGSQAQTNSNVANVALNAVVNQSIAVSVSAAAVNFNLVPGTGPTGGAPSLTVTTNWSLNPGGGPTMSLYGYFTSAGTALADGGGNSIPSANVLGSVNGGGAVAFTGTGPFGAAGASLQIYSLGITAANKTGTRNDTLDMSINLTSLPNLPAGTYTGTLSLQAQAL
ncbi:MAG: hypothetical protein ACRD88_00130 [Terriglobia bacterium]